MLCVSVSASGLPRIVTQALEPVSTCAACRLLGRIGILPLSTRIVGSLDECGISRKIVDDSPPHSRVLRVRTMRADDHIGGNDATTVAILYHMGWPSTRILHMKRDQFEPFDETFGLEIALDLDVATFYVTFA